MRPSRQLSSEDANRIAEQAAQCLARDSRVLLVYLFGSAADRARPTVRDVDLGILTRETLPQDELLRMRADLVLAVGSEIDLVALNDAPVVLAWEVAEGGRCLYAVDPEIETEFVIRARARFWDFKPFLDEQWRLAGERLQERQRGTPT